jgi:hypothetical protein
MFAYDMIARVTNGEGWPDAAPCATGGPRSVILLEVEEHLESSIVPRLIAAGANMSRVHYIKGAPLDDQDRTRLISIQRDADAIERLARQLGDVALVVVSPITSYLGEVEQNSNEQVRNEIIHPLKTMAEELGCAVVILKHPNKEWRNTDPLERIGGSAAWTEAMRCVVYIGDDPDQPEGETKSSAVRTLGEILAGSKAPAALLESPPRHRRAGHRLPGGTGHVQRERDAGWPAPQQGAQDEAGTGGRVDREYA